MNIALLLSAMWVVTAGSHGVQSNDQMCARSVELAHHLCSGDVVVPGSVKSRPGKKGEKGSIGPQGVAGERGPPGLVDYESVGDIVDEKLIPYDQKFEKLIRKLEEVTTELAIVKKREGLEECRSKLKQTESKLVNLLGKCPVRYNGTCFWGIFGGRKTTTYKQASDLCENGGGRLAGVYSNDHLNQLIMYALPQAAADTVDSAIWMHTAMTYKNGQLFQRDGSPAPNLKWRLGYPTGTGERVNVDVRVNRENAGLVQYPSSTEDGAFCEIDI